MLTLNVASLILYYITIAAGSFATRKLIINYVSHYSDYSPLAAALRALSAAIFFAFASAFAAFSASFCARSSI